MARRGRGSQVNHGDVIPCCRCTLDALIAARRQIRLSLDSAAHRRALVIYCFSITTCTVLGVYRDVGGHAQNSVQFMLFSLTVCRAGP